MVKSLYIYDIIHVLFSFASVSEINKVGREGEVFKNCSCENVNFHQNHWVDQNLYIIHKLHVHVWNFQSNYSQLTRCIHRGTVF